MKLCQITSDTHIAVIVPTKQNAYEMLCEFQERLCEWTKMGGIPDYSVDPGSHRVFFGTNSYIKICWPNRQEDGDKYHWILCEASVDSECLCNYMANIIMNLNWISNSNEDAITQEENTEAMDKWLSQFPVGTV